MWRTPSVTPLRSGPPIWDSFLRRCGRAHNQRCHVAVGVGRRPGMSQRMNMSQVVPEGYRAVAALDKYVRANVDQRVLNLVKLRASMLNGCSFCVDLHSRDAIAAGESTQRLFAAAAWREAPFFDAGERAALALTDALTRLGEHGVPDEVWNEQREVSSQEETADLILAIATTNVWNRIAVATRMQPAVV